MTQIQIAEALGRTQSWVSDVATGKINSLKWADGEKLRALARQAPTQDPT